jgi:2-keto-3-deoxy-L-rhamnonate aldolase RhmA
VHYAAEAGFHFVTVDMEHSSFDWQTLSGLAQMARAVGVTPVVRLQNATRDSVNRALDVGVLGLMVQDVDSPERVHEILSWVDSSKFAGRTGDSKDMRSELTVIIQIESRLAVDSADELLAAGGVDVVSIGRGDLAQSLGHGPDREHPEVIEAIERVVAACKRHGVYAGMAAASRMDKQEVDDLVARGFAWLTFGTDKHVLRKGFAGGMRMLREATGVGAST